MSLRNLLIILSATISPFVANAAPLKISALPEGMCALDSKIPEHATIATYLNGSATGGSELVASFASCDELQAIAQKKATSVTRYGSVLQQPKPSDLTMDRASYLATVAKSFEAAAAITQAAVAGATAATTQAAGASGVTAPSNINAASKGVLYQDPRMVIIGIEQTNNFGAASTKVASTAGMTMIGGAPISVNLYAPLSDSDAFTKSTEALKPFINRMVRENQ